MEGRSFFPFPPSLTTGTIVNQVIAQIIHYSMLLHGGLHITGKCRPAGPRAIRASKALLQKIVPVRQEEPAPRYSNPKFKQPSATIGLRTQPR